MGSWMHPLDRHFSKKMATADQRNSVMMTITKEFCNEPLAVPFLKPYEDDKKITGEYKNRIKRPMDLSTIKKKINSAQYNGYQPWIEDMNLIWDNAVEFNSADSVIGGVAIYLKKRFTKRINSITLTNLRNYEQHIINLTKDIQNILQNPPGVFNVQQSFQLTTRIEPFTMTRIQKIMDDIKKRMDNGETDEIIALIKSKESGFNPETAESIDFGLFTRKTLLALEDYIARKQAEN